jgi:hypothetical protein
MKVFEMTNQLPYDNWSKKNEKKIHIRLKFLVVCSFSII